MKHALNCMLLTLVLMVVGMGNIWGEEATYTFKSKSWESTNSEGSIECSWSGSKDGYQFNTSQTPHGVQILTTQSGVVVSSSIDFPNVTQIDVTYNSSSKAVGSISAKIGTNTSLGKQSVEKSQTNKVITFSPENSQSGKVALTFSCTTNSYAIQEIKITYTESDPDVEGETPTSGWTKNTYKAFLGGTNSFPTFFTNSNGDKTYTSSNTSVATINGNGEITLLSAGKTAITCQTSATTSFLSDSQYFTLYVSEAGPFTATFDDAVLPEGWGGRGVSYDSENSQHYNTNAPGLELGPSNYITTNSYSNITDFSFYASSSNSGNGKSLSIRYSTDNETWEEFATAILYAGETEKITVDVSPLAGKENVYLQIYSSFSTAYIDDILINTDAKYTISWYINGVISDSKELIAGSTITFSTSVATPGNSDKVFVGWTDHEILTPTNTKPELFTTATVTENKSFYAVFADKEDSGETDYVKLESNNFKTGVEYVIGAEQASDNDTMWYFCSYEKNNSQISWGKMTTAPSTNIPITFSLSQNPDAAKEYYAQDGAGNYLVGLTTSKFKMSSTKTAFTLSESGQILCNIDENYKLRHNYNLGSGGLRWYNSETGTPAYFYEVVGGVTYSNYTTRITTGPVEPKITVTNITIVIDEEKSVSELFSSNSAGTMSYEVSSTPENAVYTFQDGVFSAKTIGIYQITLTQEAIEGKYTEGTATANITVKKKNATLIFSTTECTGDLNAPNAFREPVLTTNPAGITVTYSSSSTSIAQVEATSGKITLKGEGTTTITAKFDGNDEYAEATAQYMLTVEDSSDPIITFTRVTSADELEDWGTYIIAKRNVAASEKEIPVMGHLSGNNRDAITAEYDGATIILHRSQIAQNSDQATGYARQIYLVQNDSYWNLYDAIDEQYLCAEKDVNALKNTTDDNANNALATIVINSGTFCYATITFQTDDKRKLGYNTSSGGLFSAYTSLSSSNEVALFKKTERTQKVITLWDTTNKRDSKYEQTEVERYDEINYVRTFKDDNWQALYIPFSMEVDEVGSEYKIAALNNMHQYDKDGDGVLDNSMAMEVNVLNAGTLKPNHPYLIKYTGSGTVDKTFTVTNADLYPATVTEIDCASMNRKYTFTGNYSELTGLVTLGAYSMSGGALQSAVNDESKLPCYRWYMTMTDLDDQMLHPEEMPSEIKVVVNGMWDETSISAPQAEGNDTWIDLCGIHHIGRPRPGVYLHNGRKVLVR